MTLGEMLTLADGIAPNAYSGSVKTRWLNECEGMAQMDAFLLPPEKLRQHRYQETIRISGVSFPNGATMVCPEAPGFLAGGTVKLSGLVTYDGNDSSSARRICSVSDDGKTLTFSEGSFSETGSTGDSGEAVIAYDGTGAALLIGAPHDRIYWLYLTAMLHFADGEFDRYQNCMTLFNTAYGEFIRWAARTYEPAAREQGG